MTGLQHKLQRLLAALDASFLERQEHTRLALLCLLSGHHLLLIGPPGTAKSLLARAACRCVQGADYFEYLLSRFTHPDELFGPVSIPGLKQEDYRRVTQGYLPQAHVAFLDEIFKANSAILNSLLTLINERVFHHGVHRDPAPLLALIGASNEPPDEDGNLDALYDRFLVRATVAPLQLDESFLRVSLGDIAEFSPQPNDQLTQEELAQVRAAAASVTAPPELRAALLRLRAALQAEQIEVSDRRWRWALDLLKVAAWTSGRDALSHVDLLLLQRCFGEPGLSDATVGRLVREQSLPTAQLAALLAPARARWDALAQPPSPELGLEQARNEKIRQIKDLQDEIRRLSGELDQRREALMGDFERSLWVHAAPPEALAALIGARRQAQALRDAAQEYGRRLEDFRLDQRFLEELTQSARQRQRARNFYEDEDEPVLWLCAADEPPERWAPLLMNGQVSQDAAIHERFAEKVRRWLSNHDRGAEPWHAHVLCAPLDNDRLFQWRRAPEYRWAQEVTAWFDALWEDYHRAQRRPTGWDRDTTRARFLQIVERLRWIRLEVFPEAPALPEVSP